MANKTGIVSISFRKHTPEEIVIAASEAGLDAIEWGGDVHVPHGDETEANVVRELTEAFGMKVAEYGSYYAIGKSDPELFTKVLDSARRLETKIIRVWAHQGKASDSFTEEEYQACVADAKRICAEAKDLTVALECHPNTLTDEYHTALKFIRDVGCDNLGSFWQPNQYRPLDYNLDSIRALLPYIVSVHVYSWKRKTRLPLAALESEWEEYIKLLSAKDLNYMLEFMHDDNIETLKETAATLKKWLDKA